MLVESCGGGVSRARPAVAVNTRRSSSSIARERSTVGPTRFSGDGRLLAFASEQATTEILDVAANETIRTLASGDSVGSMAFSPDGRWFVSSSREGVWVWDLTAARP